MTKSPQTGKKKDTPAGRFDYRAFVGPEENYDVSGALQFNLLTSLGLRESSKVLDIGCGSLRVGKLLLPYLQEGNYFGIEPEQWLIDEGFENELGKDIKKIKKPKFINSTEYELSKFNEKFDFMVAQSIFSHSPQSHIKKCFSEAKKTLKPKGVFAATFMIGVDNYEGNKWIYPGCVYYTEGHITKLAEGHGLVAQKIDWPHPNNQSWFVITHPNNKAAAPKKSSADTLIKLQQENKFLKARIKKYQQHPYVKAGMKVNTLLQPIKHRVNRIRSK